ncbi:MAG TPA: pyridoxamine 5'-phosphate oxidase family protein [Candidatus Limnocylindrales bacterium]|nr:pyridoxamine 5'-phosphate oxidase family protein [Candidatus Limnocylindrales bacterium]
MTATRTPESETTMVEGQSETTPWAVALDRLEHPAPGQNHWLATVRPDGTPHLMPIIAFWIDGALHFLAGEGTQKGRNLAADDRCVVGTGNLTLPSLDLIVEGRARPVKDEATVRRLAAEFGGEDWDLEARGTEVYGSHGPTAGPPPYRIYRLQATKIIGQPGMHGMFEVDRHLKPTRWTFSGD